LKKSKLLTPLIILFIILNSFSQRETENWYFGNKAALKFNYYNTPDVLQDSDMNTPFGSASISDKSGNLLFYTSGAFVYNNKHAKMENGALLASDNEVLQTAIIVPKPNSSHIYYLITLKNSSTPPRFGPLIPAGLYYSIIDMNEESGLGKVITKNILLTSLVSEKLTAVHAKDGKSIWIISFGKKLTTNSKFDTFYAFKIDENGMDIVPVISNLSNPVFINKGALKASPNGEFLLLSNESASLIGFNAETGKTNTATFLRIVHGEGMQSINSRPKAHGIEFSKDSKYIYVETIDKGKNIIFQYNTSNIAERQEVHTSTQGKSYMQLAKDGNIYLTTAESESIEGDFLSIITPPKNSNETLAEFNKDIVTLDLGTSRFGLPNFIQSYFRTRIQTESGCLLNDTVFEVDTYATITAAQWDFGDGNTSSEINPKHVYNASGFYTVTCTITINNRAIYVSKEIEIYTPNSFTISNKEMIQCDVDNNGTNFFNLTEIKDNILENSLISSISFFESEENAKDNSNEINNPTSYENTGRNQIFIRIYNDKGCYVINTFFIEAVFVQLKDIEDFFTCSILDGNAPENIGVFNLDLKKTAIRTNLSLNNNDKIRFYPDALSAQLAKDELDVNFTSKATLIWVRVDTSSGCGGIASFNLSLNQLPKTDNISSTYTICFNTNLKPPIIISAAASNTYFEWQDSTGNVISNAKDFTLDRIGDFFLTVYRTENGIECSNTKEFTVKNPELPLFSNVLVNTADETNNMVEVTISGNSSYQFSLDNINFFSNATSYTFTEVTPGLRTIYVRDVNTCESPIQQTVSVLGVQDFFTPNGDGKNDFWSIRGLDAHFYKTIEIKIFNRLGKTVGLITDFNSPGWDGRFNGKLQISNSYWYLANIIDINDNVIKKTGNFSLIRK
jgi:gliding motility-associated-like protein